MPENLRSSIELGFSASDDAARASEWLSSDRPCELRELCDAIANDYAVVENRNPPGGVFGGVHLRRLDVHDPLALLWPLPSITVRHLMFRATHLLRSLGVLTQEAGSNMTASLPVVGRALLEVVSHVDWVLRPILSNPTQIDSRSAARRALLLSLHGTADLVGESEDFDMPDRVEVSQALADDKDLAVRVFGAERVSLTATNPSRWKIEDEARPGKREIVEEVGQHIFSAGVAKASHYRMPSGAAHGSLGSTLGKLVELDRSKNEVHLAFCVDVKAVEGILWYYTVWFCHGRDLVARAHHWTDPAVRAHDADARSSFGRSVV